MAIWAHKQLRRRKYGTLSARESLTDDWVSAAELTGTDGELEYLPDTTAATQFFKVTVRLDDSWLGR